MNVRGRIKKYLQRRRTEKNKKWVTWGGYAIPLADVLSGKQTLSMDNIPLKHEDIVNLPTFTSTELKKMKFTPLRVPPLMVKNRTPVFIQGDSTSNLPKKMLEKKDR